MVWGCCTCSGFVGSASLSAGVGGKVHEGTRVYTQAVVGWSLCVRGAGCTAAWVGWGGRPVSPGCCAAACARGVYRPAASRSFCTFIEKNGNHSTLGGVAPQQPAGLTGLRRCVCAHRLLSNNKLTGTLPKEWATMTSLQHLCVRRPADATLCRVTCVLGAAVVLGLVQVE